MEAAFSVEANTSYPDPLTGKSRELDVYAISGQGIDPDRDDHEMVWSVVLCECSNNAQPMAFLAKDWGSTPFDCDKLHVSGMPDEIPGSAGGLTSVQSLLDLYSYFHHFKAGTIATQYCTFDRKRSDRLWMATHDADDHGSMSKLCDYIVWSKKEARRTWAPAGEMKDEPISVCFYFPVFVVQNDLYEARQSTGGKVELSEVDRLLFRQSNAVGAAGDFLIDVVRESALPQLLDEIEHDQGETAARIRKLHRGEFRQALESLWRTRGHGKVPRGV